MPVPEDDIVCRFVRPRDWSSRDDRPRPGAFKQAGLSVWHKARVESRGITLEDLRIEHLSGYGQAHHAAGDYIELAEESSRQEETPLEVQVEWRPEDECVAEPWRQWRDAHAQVEAIQGPAQFTPLFRRLLALNCRTKVAPDC